MGRVSVERVLSGPGLLNLYQTLGEIEGLPTPLRQPAEVTKAALAKDGLALMALERFCAILGSVAGDFALCFGAARGVYIAGGIAPDIFDVLAASDFRRRFEIKGRMSDYLNPIPTHVVVEPHAALIGSASVLKALALRLIRARRARIVATLGPASHTPEMVLALARAGADVFRLNFSHGSHEDHAQSLKMIRAAETEIDRPIGGLADLQGPKFRLGVFRNGPIEIEPATGSGSTSIPRRATPPASACRIRSCSAPCRPARGCCSTTARCG